MEVIKQGILFGEPIAKALPTASQAQKARDEALEQVSAKAGDKFLERARAFVLEYLREHGPTPGEEITEAGTLAGIVAKNLKHWGGAYLSLSRKGLIVKAGTCQRRRGHNTAGGIRWGLA